MSKVEVGQVEAPKWARSNCQNHERNKIDHGNNTETAPASSETWTSFVSFRELGGIGRLGNQLFQIAATLGTAARNGCRALFPEWEYARYFRRPLDHRLDPSRIANRYVEKYFHYEEIPNLVNLDLVGYFQSERYFSNCEKLVRYHFEPSDEVKGHINERFSHLLDQKTVSVHVRRGDYVRLAHKHSVLPIEYYRKAMSLFEVECRFLIFSDDPAWCRDVFQKGNTTIISGNPDYIDLHLMSRCSHHIIANSSFSWWGAWLNKLPGKKVIAPTVWFEPTWSEIAMHNTRDLLPSSWLKLEL